jgi:hypothetical protein
VFHGSGSALIEALWMSSPALWKGDDVKALHILRVYKLLKRYECANEMPHPLYQVVMRGWENNVQHKGWTSLENEICFSADVVSQRRPLVS